VAVEGEQDREGMPAAQQALDDRALRPTELRIVRSLLG
jgi:hypothetical protein